MFKKLLRPVAAIFFTALILLSAASANAQTPPTTTTAISSRYTGGTDTITLSSKYISPEMKITVIRPYLRTGVRYPVVYLLNGYGGDYRSWAQGQPRLQEIAQEKGIIFVCPDGRDSWYWDSPIDPKMQMESFITQTLIDVIDKSYPTKADSAHRAITGLSMGGHGAMWLGIRHPDLFGSIGCMSGGVNIIPFNKRWKMAKRLGEYDENKELWEQHTVINLVPQIKPGQNILIDCGVDDFFAEVNADLHKRLLEAGVPHDYTERPGKHSWDYWRNSIIHHITFFDEAFRKTDEGK